MQVSPTLRRTEGGYVHWCPACEEMHYIAAMKPLANGARWTFDGDLTKPTFAPSIRIEIPEHTIDGERFALERCHYHLRAGRLEFCGDCTHRLAGQTVPPVGRLPGR